MTDISAQQPDSAGLTAPQISVLMLAYNHAPFIGQAIDTALAQKLNVPYEIVIGEDCSTDNTREIVQQYAQQYPEKIRLWLPPQNQGVNRNLAATLAQCRGKYIAILEGDDYWLTPYKLQRQLDFLESHPDFAISFHNAQVQYDDNARPAHVYYSVTPQGNFSRKTPPPTSDLADLLKGNYIQTPTVMFRAGLFSEFPAQFYDLPVGDWPLHILNARHGSIGYIDEVLAVYRVHAGGVYSASDKIKRLRGAILTAQTIDAYFNYEYTPILGPMNAKRLAIITELLASNGDRAGLRTATLEYLTTYGWQNRRTGTMLRRLFRSLLPG